MGFRPAPLRLPPQLRNFIASCFISPPSPWTHSNGGVRQGRRRRHEPSLAKFNQRSAPTIDARAHKFEAGPRLADVRGIKMARAAREQGNGGGGWSGGRRGPAPQSARGFQAI